MVTIFESQTLTGFALDSTFNAYTNGYLMPAPFGLLDGEKYRVHWDGETFYCNAFSFIYNNATMVAVGNRKSIGGEDTKEPFFIFYSHNDGLVVVYTEMSDDSHTLGIYKGENGIVLKDFAGTEQEYTSVKGVGLLQSDGTEQIYTPGQPQNKTVALDFSNGDMTVKPDNGYVLTEIEIPKPVNLVPEHIKKDEVIEGIVGTFEGSGGGSSEESGVQSKAVNFYDQFGNIMYSYTRAEAAALTELPSPPEIDGFEFDAWTRTLDDIKSTDFFVDVAPMYKKNGVSCAVLVVDMPIYDLSIILNFQIGYSSPITKATIDWGDGTDSTTISGDSSSYSGSTKTSTHTYTQSGIKYIAIYRTQGTSAIYLGSRKSTYVSIVCSTTTIDLSASFFPDFKLISVIGGTTTAPYVVSGNQRLRMISSGYEDVENGTSITLYFAPSLEVIATSKYLLASSAGLLRQIPKLRRIAFSKLQSVRQQFMQFSENVTDICMTPKLSYTEFKIMPIMNVNRRIVINYATPPSQYTGTTDVQWGTEPIYVPDDAVETYKANELFSQVADCIRPISEYPDY